MNDSPVRLAIREMQDTGRKALFWAILGAVILLLGLSGPFDTIDILPLLPRFAYWAMVTLVTFFSGWFVSMVIVLTFEARRWPFWLEATLAGIGVGFVVSIEILVMNWLVFGVSPIETGYASTLVANTVVIALVVTALIIWTRRNLETPTIPPAAFTPQPPRLLARLSLDKRGTLISLSVQDHYVKVVTTRGREMLLMRLSDAIAETEGCAGLQVHRSHWVALDQVQAARRDGARGTLTMTGGGEIPFSRSFLPAVKEAGLLP